MRAWIASKGVRRTEPEYELKDALGQSGCAVCRLVLRTAARQLDILSYENVNDLDLRARLRDARGFCNRHAWQLLEQTRDPLGVALIYKDVVNTLVPELRPSGLLDRIRSAAGRRSTGSLAARLAATRECPVCLAERETEDVYLRLLGARFAEPSFGDAWAKSDGLCWPHLLAALPRARSDEALTLLAKPLSPFPGGESEGEGKAIRVLALSHGRWSAGRSLLPPDLVVDLQQRKLDAVTRPGGEPHSECQPCLEVAAGMARSLSGTLAAMPDAALLDRACERHAWQLAARDAAALEAPLATLAAGRRQALAAALDRARSERPGVVAPGRTAGWVGERAVSLLRSGRRGGPSSCALCDREVALDREAAARAVGAVQAVALCRDHLMIASRLEAARADWPGLLAYQTARWRRLSVDLAEFIRKHDYRFSQETRGDERDSPWRAVEEIAGRRR